MSRRGRNARRSRGINVHLDTHAEQAGTWRLVAECADEITSYVVMNRPDQPGVPMPTQADLAGPLGELLAREHLARCESCQADVSRVSRDPRLCR